MAKSAKTYNPGAARAWILQKREARLTDTTAAWFQKEWRKECLTLRMTAKRMTEKNWVEARSLGMHTPTL